MGRLLVFLFAFFALAAFAREDSSPSLLLDRSYRDEPTPTATPTPTPTPAPETTSEAGDRANAAERRSR